MAQELLCGLIEEMSKLAENTLARDGDILAFAGGVRTDAPPFLFSSRQ
jgi:hypothetical protein